MIFTVGAIVYLAIGVGVAIWSRPPGWRLFDMALIALLWGPVAIVFAIDDRAGISMYEVEE